MRTFACSAFVVKLQAEKLLPATRVLDDSEATGLLFSSAVSDMPQTLNGALALEHERVSFPSYPYEWCPEMLFEAGELTLELQLRAQGACLTLKDATPYNVLFDGSNPVFVDFLSFKSRTAGVATWSAYAQFVRTFFFPLLLARKRHTSLPGLFLTHGDGLSPAEVYHRLSLLDLVGPSALQFVVLPTLLGKAKASQNIDEHHFRAHSNPEQGEYVSRRLISNLRASFRRLRPTLPKESVWTEYKETMSYNDKSFASKQEFVREIVVELSPRTVLDVGCNTGHFSFLAARMGASVVSIDSDESVISRLWRRSRAEGLPITTLLMDFSRPSAALGWRNSETISFLERARGHFDIVFLLAVVHHLAVTQGIPYAQIFRVCFDIVKRGLIVEFIPEEDPMLKKLLFNKEHLRPCLTQEAFESAYAPYFSIERRLRLPDNPRSLYFLRRNT